MKITMMSTFLFYAKLQKETSRTAETAVRLHSNLENIIEDLNLQRRFHTAYKLSSYERLTTRKSALPRGEKTAYRGGKTPYHPFVQVIVIRIPAGARPPQQ